MKYAFAFAAMLASTGASAAVISSSVGGVPVGANVYESFDAIGPGGTTASGITVSFAGTDAGTASLPNVDGKYAAPYISGGNGALFGNAGNILLGDLLYTGAFRMIVDLDDMAVMRVLSDATNVIAEGEVMYRAARDAGECSAAVYLDIVSRRRARLFEAGVECMAMVHGAAAATRAAVKSFGAHVGMAYALRTDAEDGARFGVDAVEAHVARELERARAAIADMGAGALAQPERLAPFM